MTEQTEWSRPKTMLQMCMEKPSQTDKKERDFHANETIQRKKDGKWCFYVKDYARMKSEKEHHNAIKFFLKKINSKLNCNKLNKINQQNAFSLNKTRFKTKTRSLLRNAPLPVFSMWVRTEINVSVCVIVYESVCVRIKLNLSTRVFLP